MVSSRKINFDHITGTIRWQMSRSGEGKMAMEALDTLGSQVPQAVLEVLHQLEKQDHSAWLVGGCVRDLLQGQNPQDFDLASSAKPQEVAAIFPRHALTGLAHGTVTVFNRGLAIEVTTFRSETDYGDGRRPDHVTFERSIDADLSRRDFTINSMAYHPDRGLKDPFCGRRDLQNKILRCVGDSQTRFQEDALRLLRAVRFCAQLDFQPDAALLQAAAVTAKRVCLLSRERMYRELNLILAAPYPKRLQCFDPSRILALSAGHFLDLPLAHDETLTQTISHLARPTWQESQKLTCLSWVALRVQDRGTEKLSADSFIVAWRKRLVHTSRLPRKLAWQVGAQLYWIGLRLQQSQAERLTPPQWRCFLSQLSQLSRYSGKEALETAVLSEAVLKACFEDGAVPSLQSFPPASLPPLTLQDLAVHGRDLKEAGMAPGPAMQRTLYGLLTHVINHPEDNCKDNLLKLARKRGLLP